VHWKRVQEVHPLFDCVYIYLYIHVYIYTYISIKYIHVNVYMYINRCTLYLAIHIYTHALEASTRWTRSKVFKNDYQNVICVHIYTQKIMIGVRVSDTRREAAHWKQAQDGQLTFVFLGVCVYVSVCVAFFFWCRCWYLCLSVCLSI